MTAGESTRAQYETRSLLLIRTGKTT